jgi:hypothetical protein
MFQYAFGRTNAKRLGVELKIDLSDPTLFIHNGFELERLFNIQASKATSEDIKSVLGIQRHIIIRNFIKAMGFRRFINSPILEEPHFHFSSEMLRLKRNSYVNGYWQSEKYFSDIKSEIQTEFSFKLPLSKKNSDLAKKINKLNSVSVHVRRNDYANNSNVNAVHGLCSLNYYMSAIQYVVERVEKPFFFIFSDDPTWVKENFKIDYPFEFIAHNQGAESYNDMRLMSMCKHHVIANSSFSWWGAWLNLSDTKIVITPKEWFVKEINTIDLIPGNWVRI